VLETVLNVTTQITKCRNIVSDMFTHEQEIVYAVYAVTKLKDFAGS